MTMTSHTVSGRVGGRSVWVWVWDRGAVRYGTVRWGGMGRGGRMGVGWGLGGGGGGGGAVGAADRVPDWQINRVQEPM